MFIFRTRDSADSQDSVMKKLIFECTGNIALEVLEDILFWNFIVENLSERVEFVQGNLHASGSRPSPGRSDHLV